MYWTGRGNVPPFICTSSRWSEWKPVCLFFFDSADEVLLKPSGAQLTVEFLEEHSFSVPVMVLRRDGLGMTLPPASFSVTDVEHYIGVCTYGWHFEQSIHPAIHYLINLYLYCFMGVKWSLSPASIGKIGNPPWTGQSSAVWYGQNLIPLLFNTGSSLGSRSTVFSAMLLFTSLLPQRCCKPVYEVPHGSSTAAVTLASIHCLYVSHLTIYIL